MAASKIAPGLLASFSKEINEAVVNGTKIPESLLKQLSPETVENFQKNIATGNYWSRRLANEVDKFTVIFGLLSIEGFYTPDMSIVLDYVALILDLKDIRTVYTSENRNFIGISFYSEDSANIMYQKMQNMGPQTVVFLGHSLLNTFNVRILWATPQMKIENVLDPLNDILENSNIEFDKIHKNGIEIPTTEMVGTITLKKDKSLKDIPHMSKVKGYATRKVLFVVKGRASICLRCQEEGHIRRTCPKTYCTACHSLHLPHDKCQQKSYSSITKKQILNQSIQESQILQNSNHRQQQNQSYSDSVSNHNLSKLDKYLKQSTGNFLLPDPWYQEELPNTPDEIQQLDFIQPFSQGWEVNSDLTNESVFNQEKDKKKTNSEEFQVRHKVNLNSNIKDIISKPTALKRPNPNSFVVDKDDCLNNINEDQSNPSKKSHPIGQHLSSDSDSNFS